LEGIVIQSKLFLCSESAAIDARTNTLCAFHIIEQFNAPSFPFVVPRVAILAFLSREEADPSIFQLRLQIFSGVQELFDGPLSVNFAHQLSSRTVVDLNGLLVPAPVQLRFLLLNEDHVLDSWSVIVNQLGQPGLQLNLPPQPPPAPAI
jgi:hypothetical protein